jgi:hypothetical protein
MSATAFTSSAAFAGWNCGRRVSCSMNSHHPTHMYMHPTCTMGMVSMAAMNCTSTDGMIIGTGVVASVSLFVSVHLRISIIPLLLGLVLLISLTLSGLTGLRGLVGLALNTA